MRNSIRSKRAFVFPLLMLITYFLASSILSAQVQLVTFEGLVTDAENSPLPGASVNLKNMDSGYSYSALTKDNGRFIISGIDPGRYEVEVSLTGFTKQIRRGMTFNVGARITLDFKLALSSIEETVEVIAEAPLVEVTKSEVSAVVGRKQIDDLPVVSRSFSQLALLQPGT